MVENVSLTLPSRQVIEDIVTDIRDRQLLGIRRYGRPLVTFNGREGLRDLYEELLDGLFYIRQIINEHDQTLEALPILAGCLAAYARGLDDNGVQASLVIEDVFGEADAPDEEREEYEREDTIED